MKSATRKELAAAAGVSRQTLMRWLKADRDELCRLGWVPGKHIFPPSAVRYICRKYCIDFE